MEVQNPVTDGLKHTFKATIPSAAIESKTEERLREKGKNLTLPGFRKGKAPLKILKQRYGHQVMGEVVQDSISSHLHAYVKDNNFKLAGTPKADITSYDEQKGLDLDVIMYLLPELKVPDYEKIKLDKLIVSNYKDRLKETLEVMASQNTSSEPLAKPRPAKKGDIAHIDFEGFVNDKPFDGGKASDYPLELGSGSFIPGFEEQIEGKNVGESFDVTVHFPKDYHAKNLAGNEAVFKVKLLALKQKKLPEINDEFAKKYGFDSLKKLEEAVENRLKVDAEGVTRRHLKRQILRYFAEKLDSPVPENMLQQELDSIWREYQAELQRGDIDETHATREEFNESFSPIAKQRILLGLAMAEVGLALNVKVEASEIRRSIMQYASQYPGEEKKIYDRVIENPEFLNAFQAPIYEEKVIDAIISKASFNEKEVTLSALLEDIERLDEESSKLLQMSPKKSSKAEEDAKEASKKDTKQASKAAPQKKAAKTT